MPTTLATAPPVLLAAGLDWLEGLLPVVFVLIWIVSQVWAVFRRAAAPQRPAGGPVPRPVRPRAAGDRAPVERPDGPGRTELERQIEEFLLESRGRQVQQPDAAAGGRGERRPATKPRPAPAATTRTTRPSEPRTVAPPRRGDASAGGAASGAAPAGGGAQDTANAPRTRDALAPAFGGDVARHVTEAFASDLKHRIAPAAVTPALPAALPSSVEQQGTIVDLLREPDSLRRLVISREVLDRPVERW